MKRMLVAVAIALLPLTVAPVLAATNASDAPNPERPKICFVFGPWKYCI